MFKVHSIFIFIVILSCAHNKSPHYKDLHKHSVASPKVESNQVHEPEKPSFSSTQKLSIFIPKELKSDELTYITEPQIRSIKLPPQPSVASEQTQNELKYLLSLKSERSDDFIKRVSVERNFAGLRLGNLHGYDLALYGGSDIVSEFFTKVFHDITVATFYLKIKFDRVRPHFLEPAIEPVIIVPRHPAYPSGHSAQAFTTALVLSEVFPEDRERFLQDAYNIARNREIAGVHYPSDTWAGFILAQKYVKLAKTHKNFKKDIEKVKQVFNTVEYYKRLLR
ncbi:MAG: phosphatase PAP2 family protein [Bacteriovoracaceae bacterium]|nr:phosphatase PAP2 family protein [Bacteriovoracaceae bacterium]